MGIEAVDANNRCIADQFKDIIICMRFHDTVIATKLMKRTKIFCVLELRQ